MKKLCLLILCFYVLSNISLGQNLSASFDLKNAYQIDTKIRKTGMLILGGWAAANMIAGGIGRSQLSGEQKYFHEMNLYWNIVNLGIAGAGYYFTVSGNMPEDAAAQLAEQIKLQKTLLFNAGLDLAYIAGGFYLLERSKNTSTNQLRFKGYGKSLILQGGFLFAFDLILHTIHQNNTVKIPDFVSSLYIGPQQLGFCFTF